MQMSLIRVKEIIQNQISGSRNTHRKKGSQTKWLEKRKTGARRTSSGEHGQAMNTTSWEEERRPVKK